MQQPAARATAHMFTTFAVAAPAPLRDPLPPASDPGAASESIVTLARTHFQHIGLHSYVRFSSADQRIIMKEHQPLINGTSKNLSRDSSASVKF
jgi:hypothetical protein